MASFHPHQMSDDEYKKWKENVMESLRGLPIYQFDNDIYPRYSEPVIPFEQGSNGTLYGYKILSRYPNFDWLISPNMIAPNFVWINNRLSADVRPDKHPETGIYGTKDLESLNEWASTLATTFYNISHRTLTVKIAVWGVVVETTRGFRAEHAKIVKVLRRP